MRFAADWRLLAAGPVVAASTVVTALFMTNELGLALRDPDHVAATYLVLVGLGMTLLVGVDIVVRAAARSCELPPPRGVIRRVRIERWTLWRGVVVASALISFYATYLAYRNLKAIVPLLRPEVLFDRELAEIDRSLFGGHDPAALLHTLLGTGVPTHVLSAFYVAFIVFLPLGIGLTLVFSSDLRAGVFYTTAQSLNWVFGAASYFLLPSLGPIYADPGAFAILPVSEVTRLQDILLDQRIEFLRDPATGTPQSIAGFASLHISMSLTAAAAAHLLGLGRRVKIGLWIWFAMTTLATIHLGWHYFLDDLGGLAVAAAALALARALTGVDLRSMRRSGRSAARIPVDGSPTGAAAYLPSVPSSNTRR